MGGQEAIAARVTYDAMAPYYDAFTSHHDYELWTTIIRRLARRHGMTGTRLLDVGCGTGKSFLPFLAEGWSVTACDISPRMLELAAAKARGVPLHVADVRELPLLGSFDLVLMLDDVVNYVTDPSDLTRVFAGARANLDHEGVVVFDVNLLRAYRTFFAAPAVVEAEGQLLVWRGRTSEEAEPGVLSEAILDAFEERAHGKWERCVSLHHQRHHPQDRILAALADAGLECAGVYGHGLDGRPVAGCDELRDTKALYIARHARREVGGGDPC
jgi:SAM-dependent methyltransferase